MKMRLLALILIGLCEKILEAIARCLADLTKPHSSRGEHTAASNAAFDEYLRAENQQWGVRNLDDVVAVARAQNLTLKQIYQMPANNLSVVFQRST